MTLDYAGGRRRRRGGRDDDGVKGGFVFVPNASSSSSADGESEFYAAQDARHKAFIVANEMKEKKVPKIVKRTLIAALVLGVLGAFFLGYGGWVWVALISLCSYASGTEYFALMSKVNEELPFPRRHSGPRSGLSGVRCFCA